MRRWLLSMMIIVGLGCISLGLGLLVNENSVLAQDNSKQAEYAGSRECTSCHRGIARDHAVSPHAQALQDTSRKKDAILGDFTSGNDVRTVQLPGEDQPRPFTADDIAFAVGAGRNVQRYLYKVKTNQYVVLPAQWNTIKKVWEPYNKTDNWFKDPAMDWLQSCAGCHTTGLDTEKGKWKDVGVQCEACHGPGSIHVDTAKSAGNRPSKSELVDIHSSIVLTPDAQVCGQCHSQGTEPKDHRAYPVDYQPGGTLLDDKVFTLYAPDDSAHWWKSGHAKANNMQFNEWLNSAHANSLDVLKKSDQAKDDCLQCHSGEYRFTERLDALYKSGDLNGTPPDMPTLQTAQFGITCVTCHSPHNAAKDAEFNLVDPAYTLCTSCHQNTPLTGTPHHPVKEMFEGISLVDGVPGVPSAHFSAENGPRCVTCHMPDVPIETFSLASHSLKPIIPGATDDQPPPTCLQCHKTLTTGDLQSLVSDTQDAVRNRLTTAWARLGSVKQPDAGTPARQQYDQVVDALTFVQNDGSLGVHNYAYTDALLTTAEQTLSELSVPSSNLNPTEAPAPTATPAVPLTTFTSSTESISSGARPITVVILGIAFLILLVAAYFFFRRPRNQEA